MGGMSSGVSGSFGSNMGGGMGGGGSGSFGSNMGGGMGGGMGGNLGGKPVFLFSSFILNLPCMFCFRRHDWWRWNGW
jgi:hypothetical protein